MRIDISNGYVLLCEFVNRKASREYNRLLLNQTKMSPTGGIDAEGNPVMTYEIDPYNLELANEALILGMVQKAYVVDANGEHEVPVNQAWIDSLQVPDFDTVCNAVIEVKRNKDKDSKK